MVPLNEVFKLRKIEVFLRRGSRGKLLKPALLLGDSSGHLALCEPVARQDLGARQRGGNRNDHMRLGFGVAALFLGRIGLKTELGI